MDRTGVERALAMFEGRGQLEPIENAGQATAGACLDRARKRSDAIEVLLETKHWETAFTTAYDAYRTAADAIVLLFGYRVPAVRGAHRVATDLAHAALKGETNAFSPAIAERFRSGRHESEYFDPGRPVDKTEDDARWARARASAALEAVAVVLSTL